MYQVPILVLLILPLLVRSENSISFLALGDWGGDEHSPYYTQSEEGCSKQMGIQASLVAANFTISLGDNMYYHGVKNEDDARFNETFERVFTADSLQHTWYVIAGNHDHYGNITGQIAYSSHSKRWTFPSLYYNKIFQIPGSKATLEIVFIDTIILSGMSDSNDPNKPYEMIYDRELADDQWKWINDTLKSSTADWLLVAGHYPVYSIAEHGPTRILIDKLNPMLRKNKVTAYLCGHDHNMQHLYELGIDYFVIGAGHFVDSSKAHKNDVPSGSLKFFYGEKNSWSDGAFASFTVSSKNLTMTYINVKKQSIYKVTKMTPRNV